MASFFIGKSLKEIINRVINNNPLFIIKDSNLIINMAISRLIPIF